MTADADPSSATDFGAMRAATPGVVEEHVRVRAACGDLEARFAYPESRPAAAGVLLLSPHPRFGGDMDNNVIAAASAALADAGFACLRFNYRGVGASDGPFRDALESFKYWSDLVESDACGAVLEDVSDALAWLQRHVSGVHVFGYSFGAVMALRLAASAALRSVAVIGLAAGEYDFSFCTRVRTPVLAVHSADDFATPVGVVEEKLALLRGPSRLEVLHGTDHFFRGREDEVTSLAARFFEEH